MLWTNKMKWNEINIFDLIWIVTTVTPHHNQTREARGNELVSRPRHPLPHHRPNASVTAAATCVVITLQIQHGPSPFSLPAAAYFAGRLVSRGSERKKADLAFHYVWAVKPSHHHGCDTANVIISVHILLSPYLVLFTLDSFVGSITAVQTVGHRFKSTPTNGPRFMAPRIPWWSPIQVLTPHMRACLRNLVADRKL